jgi:hypothetical protein
MQLINMMTPKMNPDMLEDDEDVSAFAVDV